MSKINYTYNLRFFWMTWVMYEVLFTGIFSLFLVGFGYFTSEQTVKDSLLFENNTAFLLLLLIPIFFFIQFRSMKKRNNMVNTLANNKFHFFLFRPVNNKKVIIQFILIRNILFFLILALANPLMGKMKQNTKGENLELVVCLDISNSMNVKDIDATSRLEVAKRALGQLVNQFTGERVGICVFAGNAFVQLPLTMDYHAAKLFIQEIQTDMISAQGTNVSAALSVANQMFTKLKTSKGILLVTDGEDHEGLNDTIITSLKEKKVEIAILGIGTEKGGSVPVDMKKPGLGNKQTSNGETIISKLNPEFIKTLAEELNGSASVTTQAFPNVKEVLTEINQMKQGNSRNLEIEINESWYQVPLLLSVFSFVGLLLNMLYKPKSNAA